MRHGVGGVAMSYFHPLWAPPTPAEMEQGVRAVASAQRIGGKTDVERGLIDAVDAFYRASDVPETAPPAQSCHGPRAHGARSQAFSARLAALHQAHPDNLEVTIFYALSLL